MSDKYLRAKARSIPAVCSAYRGLKEAKLLCRFAGMQKYNDGLKATAPNCIPCNKEKNFRSRLEFVRFWADYVRKSPNKVWSKQQADFINSVLGTASRDVELYRRVKDAVNSHKSREKK